MPTPDLLDPSKEHSLVLIKPDGVRRGLTGEILHRIEQKGFVLKGLKIKKASAKNLEEHYEEHVDRHYFPALRDYMMEGPLVAVVVEGDRVADQLLDRQPSFAPQLRVARDVACGGRRPEVRADDRSCFGGDEQR